MKAIIISTDESAFSQTSDTHTRFLAYARAIGEVYFIVVAREHHETIRIDEGGAIICASGKLRVLALRRAYTIGSHIKGVEVVSAQDPFEQGFIGWLIAKRLKAKLHLQIHTDIGSPYFAEGLKNNIRVRIARFLLSRADAIRAVSERVKTAVVREFRAPLHLVSVLPIQRMAKVRRDIVRRESNDLFPEYHSVILVISRLAREKNVALALRAFALIARSHPKTGLLILGDGPEKTTLSNLAVSLGIDTQVKFLGFQEDIEYYLYVADVYLHASDYEGYGRTLIEAVLLECPIVTTDVGLVGSVLTKEDALICPPRNEKCLASHLSLLLGNPQLGVRLVASAKKTVQHAFSGTTEEYVSAYRDDLARTLAS